MLFRWIIFSTNVHCMLNILKRDSGGIIKSNTNDFDFNTTLYFVIRFHNCKIDDNLSLDHVSLTHFCIINSQV